MLLPIHAAQKVRMQRCWLALIRLVRLIWKCKLYSQMRYTHGKGVANVGIKSASAFANTSGLGKNYFKEKSKVPARHLENTWHMGNLPCYRHGSLSTTLDGMSHHTSKALAHPMP